MEMVDLGRSLGEPVASVGETKSKEKKYYPTLSVEAPPESLAEKPIGHVCRLNIVARVKSISEDSDGKPRIELEVQKLGYASPGQKTKDEYLSMSQKDRETYDSSQVEEPEQETEEEEPEEEE